MHVVVDVVDIELCIYVKSIELGSAQARLETTGVFGLVAPRNQRWWFISIYIYMYCLYVPNYWSVRASGSKEPKVVVHCHIHIYVLPVHATGLVEPRLEVKIYCCDAWLLHKLLVARDSIPGGNDYKCSDEKSKLNRS